MFKERTGDLTKGSSGLCMDLQPYPWPPVPVCPGLGVGATGGTLSRAPGKSCSSASASLFWLWLLSVLTGCKRKLWSFLCFFFFPFLFYIGAQLINVVLVSGVQQGDSVIHTHASFLFQILFPIRLLQNTEQNSLCYTESSYWFL